MHGVKGTVVGANTIYIRTGTPGPDPDAAETIEQTDDTNPGVETPKKETVPAKYNSKTTLKEDVKAGENTFNFDLTSK